MYNIYQSGPRKGQPKTLTDRVVRFIVEGIGFIEVPSRSRYRQFENCDKLWFVGKAGSVRSGKCSSKSVSITAGVKKKMEEWEKTL